MFETHALYQNDPRWKDVKLGNQNKETIGSWGCLMTSMTMVANGFGNDETPETINEKMKNAGGFQGAMIIPAALPSVVSGVIFKGYQPCEDFPAPLSQIDSALARNMPVIAQVDWSPNAGIQTHWIVIYDKDDDGYLMKDPYRYKGDAPDKPLHLMDRYKFSGKDPAQAISGLIWYEGTAPATPPKPKEKKPIPADSITVYSTADGLSFRADPSLAGYLIKRVPLACELKTLEGKASADPKIGVNGQWLNVQEPEGDQGYVAAWYVARTKEEALAEGEDDSIVTPPPIPTPKPAPTTTTPQPAPATPQGDLILEPTTDGVAFRTQPVVAENTLIARLPLGTSITVTEPVAEARKKVGVYGQWIKGKANGREGVVAAWYVKLSAQAAPTPVVKTSEISGNANPTTQMVVTTSTEGVALRSTPVVASHTLIKRLPNASKLYILEQGAEAKVGRYGQWIKVRDEANQVGVVAAWYVEKNS